MNHASRVAVALLVLMLAGTASAKTSSSPPPGVMHPAPGGSYIKTCSKYEWDGKMQIMNATCKNPASTWPVSSSLNYSTACAPGSTVGVTRGMLRCDKLNKFRPIGTFAASCKGIIWNSYTQSMSADCADAARKYHPISLAYGDLCVRGSSIGATLKPSMFCDKPKVKA